MRIKSKEVTSGINFNANLHFSWFSELKFRWLMIVSIKGIQICQHCNFVYYRKTRMYQVDLQPGVLSFLDQNTLAVQINDVFVSWLKRESSPRRDLSDRSRTVSLIHSLTHSLTVVCVSSQTFDFFLNRAELSLNSVKSENLKIAEAWIGLNLKILSLTCVLLVLW